METVPCWVWALLEFGNRAGSVNPTSQSLHSGVALAANQVKFLIMFSWSPSFPLSLSPLPTPLLYHFILCISPSLPSNLICSCFRYSYFQDLEKGYCHNKPLSSNLWCRRKGNPCNPREVLCFIEEPAWISCLSFISASVERQTMQDNVQARKIV